MDMQPTANNVTNTGAPRPPPPASSAPISQTPARGLELKEDGKDTSSNAPAQPGPRVAIYGAYGFTGALTISRILSTGRIEKDQLVVCGRRKQRLLQLARKHGLDPDSQVYAFEVDGQARSSSDVHLKHLSDLGVRLLVSCAPLGAIEDEPAHTAPELDDGGVSNVNESEVSPEASPAHDVENPNDSENGGSTATEDGVDSTEQRASFRESLFPTLTALVRSCIANQVHYIDLSAHVDELEAIRRLDSSAAKAGVMLLPACGLHSVPTECLASRAHEALPSADTLEVGVYGTRSSVSSGNLPIFWESTSTSSRTSAAVSRVDGRLVRGHSKSRQIPFRESKSYYHSVNITSTSLPLAVLSLVGKSVPTYRHVTAFLGTPGIGSWASYVSSLSVVKNLIDADTLTRLAANSSACHTPPTDEELEWGQSFVWVCATDSKTADSVEMRLDTREGHLFAALCLSEVISRVLEDPTRYSRVFGGFQTASDVFGADFPMEIHDARIKFETVAARPKPPERSLIDRILA